MIDKNRSKIKYFVYILILFGIFMFINLGVVEKFDDRTFMKSFAEHNYDIVEWCEFFWNNWSSRVVISGITVWLVTKNPLYFDIINALMQTFVIVFVSQLAKKGVESDTKIKNSDILLFTFVLYMVCIPYEIRLESDLWRMASSTYLWGVAGALFCMIFFTDVLYKSGKKYSLAYFSAAIAWAMYVSGCEQVAPIIVVFGVFVLLYNRLYRKEKNNVGGWIIVIVAAAVFAICLLCPGNSKRTQTEILMNASYFPMTSYIERIFFGVVTAVKLVVENCYILMLIISITLYMIVRKKNANYIEKVITLLPFTYFGGYSLIKWYNKNLPGIEIPFSLDYKLYDIIQVSVPQISYSINQWVSTYLAIFICVLLAGSLFFYLCREDGLFTGLIYSAAFADIAIVGLTVSGRFAALRTAFIPAVMLILVAVKLSVILITKYDKQEKNL